MPLGQVREQGLDIRPGIHVVQHQQPARMRLQPAHRPPGGLALLRHDPGVRVQPEGEFRQAGLDRLRAVRRHPPHQRVLPAVGVRVLQRQLALADPAQAVDRLRLRHHPRTRGDQPPQRGSSTSRPTKDFTGGFGNPTRGTPGTGT